MKRRNRELEIRKRLLRSLTALKFWAFEKSEQRRNKRPTEDLGFSSSRKLPGLVLYPPLISSSLLHQLPSLCFVGSSYSGSRSVLCPPLTPSSQGRVLPHSGQRLF